MTNFCIIVGAVTLSFGFVYSVMRLTAFFEGRKW